MSALFCVALMGAHAEEQDSIVYEFNPHWYIQGAFGYQYTIGESDAATLSSPNAQLGFGYNFTPVWGLRFNVNAWQSRDGYIPGDLLSDELRAKFYQATNNENLEWKWYYVAPALDVTMDLTNLIGGWKHDRVCNVGLFAGIGANIFFKNDQAVAANQTLVDVFGPSTSGNERLELLWGQEGGCKASVLGQAGVFVDFRITDHFRMGLELQGDMLADKYNSKKAENPDWYLNALVTARYNFGATYKEKRVKKPQDCGPCEPSIVEKTVHDTVYINNVDTIDNSEPLKVEIFFQISSDYVNPTEYTKVMQVVDFMRAHPESKVSITGYADRGTGNPTINQRISEKRANVVKNELINKYGIAADRIEAKAMGDSEQPHGDDPILNRVSICIVK